MTNYNYFLRSCEIFCYTILQQNIAKQLHEHKKELVNSFIKFFTNGGKIPPFLKNLVN